MTKSEYQELVEFLAGQFTAIGDRFTGVEERLTRVEVFAEENRHLIQTVAEGVTTVNRKVDRLREEMLERFADQRAFIESLRL